MIPILITYIAFLTLVLVTGIHHYEEKLKKAKAEEARLSSMFDAVATGYSQLLSEYRDLKYPVSEPKPE